ncbi:MAG: phenylacetate-CoA oxygenase subunit PaaJ [Burkholderiales bacterium]|nr:phenylacetate-CoA oxygenase subunit PaaJ [Burkholderiales bacterium]
MVTVTAAPVALTLERAWDALHAVPDPEISVISVTELGIVRGISIDGDRAVVTVTPTYAGCPATEVIARSIEAALRAAGAARIEVRTQLAPAWTTDWIAVGARERLRDYGIVPPCARAAGEQPIRLHPRGAAALSCPRCGSSDTERLSQFGATPCKALYRCRACREPFEYFKPH